ncbi:glycosyltransferase involved in cell wall biosynthesis [Pedobacter sp. UYP30]|uniref:glycosyltransferase family 2 protein n=1 Tax=Pedobacter sp. UYP30 TaxID=1756400 RepID=UPI003395E21A
MNLISIIVPCYNQAIFLEETLKMVLCQSYSNWECIMVNDGSTDDTERIAKQFTEKDNRFIYLFQSNKGLSNARNTGILNAKGEFIQLLDSDDLLEKNKLEATLNLYHQKKDPNIVYYSSMRYFEDGFPNDLKILGRDNFIAHVELKEEDGLVSQKEVIRLRNPFVISAPLYPIALFKEVGNFDESLTALEDWDFHIRCSLAGFTFHHFYEKKALTLIRLHNSSMMRNQKLLDESFFQLIAKHNLRKIEIPNKKELKDYLKDFIPPIFLKLKQYLLKN